jgi:hypothetical protein
MFTIISVTCPKLPVIRASLRQAEIAIWPTANDISVRVALAIVFPEADFADFESARIRQGPIAAAWTWMTGHGEDRFDLPVRVVEPAVQGSNALAASTAG